LEYESKELATRQFYYRPDEPEHADARRHFLVDHNIRYVVYGPHERAAGAPTPAGEFLEPRYVTPELSIFEVEAARRVER
jgi:hypothetical protein